MHRAINGILALLEYGPCGSQEAEFATTISCLWGAGPPAEYIRIGGAGIILQAAYSEAPSVPEEPGFDFVFCRFSFQQLLFMAAQWS